MLTALAVVHYKERKMPEQRAEPYSAILKWLTEARETRPGMPARGALRRTAVGLAVAMQCRPNGLQTRVELGWLAERLSAEFSDTPERERFSHTAFPRRGDRR